MSPPFFVGRRLEGSLLVLPLLGALMGRETIRSICLRHIGVFIHSSIWLIVCDSSLNTPLYDEQIHFCRGARLMEFGLHCYEEDHTGAKL